MLRKVEFKGQQFYVPADVELKVEVKDVPFTEQFTKLKPHYVEKDGKIYELGEDAKIRGSKKSTKAAYDEQHKVAVAQDS